MRVFWGAAGSETELGLTEEGSVLRIEQEQTAIFTEEHAGPVTKVMTRERVTCELILKQWDAVQLAAVIPGSINTGGTKITGGRVPGINLSGTDYAKRLWLHPLQTTDTTDVTDAVYIHLAIPQPQPIEARFDNESAALIGVVFEGIVDTSQADGVLLYDIRTN
jgi:hypothetical protein